MRRQSGKAVIIAIIFVAVLLMSRPTVSAQSLDLILNQPDDITFNIGETGKSIDWSIECGYVLYWTITQNGVIVREGTWSEGIISYPLEDLGVGSYTFTIELHSDAICFPPNTACIMLQDTDTVEVTVLGLGLNQLLSPTGFVLIWGLLGVTVIGLVIKMKR